MGPQQELMHHEDVGPQPPQEPMSDGGDDGVYVQPEDDEGGEAVDIIAYAHVVRRYFDYKVPLARMSPEVASIVLPHPGAGRLIWENCGSVSVRVNHVGEMARPTLTW